MNNTSLQIFELSLNQVGKIQSSKLYMQHAYQGE